MLWLLDVMEELRDSFVVSQLLLRFVLGRVFNAGLGTAGKFEVPGVGVNGLTEGVDSMMDGRGDIRYYTNLLDPMLLIVY